jgi:hypothetical protein
MTLIEKTLLFYVGFTFSVKIVELAYMFFFAIPRDKAVKGNAERSNRSKADKLVYEQNLKGCFAEIHELQLLLAEEKKKTPADLQARLDQAIRLLRAGKARFTPHTTNSDVDVFLAENGGADV